MLDDDLGRRGVLAGAGGLGVIALGGCAAGDGKVTAIVPERIRGKVIAKTSEIPVGGGKILSDYKIVITQPTKGDFKAFTAVCTHQHCTVGDIRDGVIECPCHGSEFSVKDGSVEQGPAKAALPAFKVKVTGDGIAVS